jgi:hypothetical protein
VATKHAARFALYLVLYSCVIVFCLTVAGCDDFSFYDLLDIDKSSEPTGDFAIIPFGDVMVLVGEQTPFKAVNGTPPYTFVVTSGQGSIDGSTGVFTAPDTVGISEVTVIDSTGATRKVSIIIVE